MLTRLRFNTSNAHVSEWSQWNAGSARSTSFVSNHGLCHINQLLLLPLNTLYHKVSQWLTTSRDNWQSWIKVGTFMCIFSSILVWCPSISLSIHCLPVKTLVRTICFGLGSWVLWKFHYNMNTTVAAFLTSSESSKFTPKLGWSLVIQSNRHLLLYLQNNWPISTKWGIKYATNNYAK